MAIDTTGKMTMKEALPRVYSDFERLITDSPSLILMNTDIATMRSDYPEELDWFGQVSSRTFRLFDGVTRDLLMNEGQEDNNELYQRFRVARLGIGVISLYTELAALKLIDAERGEATTVEEVAEIVRNGYTFFEDIFDSGGEIGAVMAREFIVNDDDVDGWGWFFRGIMVGNKVERGHRMTRFEVRPTETGDDRVVLPINLDPVIELYKDAKPGRRERQRSLVNCPAHVYRDPGLGVTYARRLFDIIVNYAEANVLPDFIPMARKAMQSA